MSETLCFDTMDVDSLQTGTKCRILESAKLEFWKLQLRIPELSPHWDDDFGAHKGFSTVEEANYWSTAD